MAGDQNSSNPVGTPHNTRDQTMNNRLKVALLYGGRTPEHEISCESAAGVIRHLDRSRFDITAIGVDRQGRWLVQDTAALLNAHHKALPIDPAGEVVLLAPNPTRPCLVGDGTREVDLFFPLMHGPLCEDGAIQGLFELADVPYVGVSLLGSAVCMNKDTAKRLVLEAGIETAPWITLRGSKWRDHPEQLAGQIVEDLGLPLFVKPANMGSSVGVSRVDTTVELVPALEAAYRFDTTVIIEKAINAREIELGLLSSKNPGGDPEVSVPGEVQAEGAFYSYERKYLESDGAQLSIPADLSSAEVADAQQIAVAVGNALEIDGLARIDLFLNRDTGRLLFNEANTMPGFTEISMFPKLWQASGVDYGSLLSRLIEHALQRHQARQRLQHQR